MSNKLKKIGFIGLGRMGKPMANNIINGGFELTVYDVRPAAIAELVQRGARAAGSAREVAEASAIVELMVVDDAQVEEVLTSEQGVFAGAHAGTVVAIHSTVSPETVERLAEIGAKTGVKIIDAPVSGGETGAREKSLCYMVGGDPSILEFCREVFSTSAGEIFHLGKLGSGAAAKTIVQVVTCINMLAAQEAECVAEKTGLDFRALQKLMRGSSAQSFVIDNWLDRFKLAGDPVEIRRRRTEVFQKSLAPALELSRRLGVPLDGTHLAERLLPRIMGLDDTSSGKLEGK